MKLDIEKLTKEVINMGGLYIYSECFFFLNENQVLIIDFCN
jgi:hypothetical protein